MEHKTNIASGGQFYRSSSDILISEQYDDEDNNAENDEFIISRKHIHNNLIENEQVEQNRSNNEEELTMKNSSDTSDDENHHNKGKFSRFITLAKNIIKPALAWIACLLVHVFFGMHPIFSRYLQHQTENKFPSLMLLSMCHIAALLIYSPRMVYMLFVYIRGRMRRSGEENKEVNSESLQVEEQVALWKRIIRKVKQYLPLISFYFCITARSLTNIMASKFTNAVFVQLLALATPFILAIATIFIYNRWFLRDSNKKESFGLISWLCMIATVIGGAIIILGNVVAKSETPQPWYAFLYTYEIAWSTLSENITWWDLLGITLSLISSTCLVWYQLNLKYMKQEEHNSGSVSVTGENLFVLQLFIVGITFLIPSLFMDDWTLWLRLNVKDWLMFFGMTIFVYMMANHLNIFALGILGSSVVGSIIALRLVSTIIFSIVILHESLKSIWQLIGSVIVLLAVSYFLYSEYRNEKKKQLEKKEEEMKNSKRQLEENTLEMEETIEETVEEEPSNKI